MCWVWTLGKTVNEEAAALETLEPRREVTLLPLATPAGAVVVTSWTMGAQRRQQVIVWGTFARLRGGMEETMSGRGARLALVGPEGRPAS